MLSNGIKLDRLFAAIVLSLCGCDDNQKRLNAVSEVEKACDLPLRTLRMGSPNEINGKAIKINGRIESVDIRSVIWLGEYSRNSPVAKKLKCIWSYRSNYGYHFTVRLVSPF